jgi:hypothetical protein
MLDDISFLVQETLRDVEKNQKNKNFFGSFFNSKQDLPAEVSGVLFHIQKNAATFVIRIHVCENLKNDYFAALKHPDLFPTLRFESEDSLRDELLYFECDDIRIASLIKERLGNKRFPIFEEQIFNISDPGDSWWLKREGKKLSICFKLSHTDTEAKDGLIKLGPLGDGDKMMDIFAKLYGYFQMLFPVEDYSSAFGQFSLSPVTQNDESFEQFYDLLATGDVHYKFWEKLRNLELQHSDKPYASDLKQANYFIMELSELRRFWCDVQAHL